VGDKFEWKDLGKFWDTLIATASERDNQKRKFKSSRYYNEKSHFIGLCGEMTYSIITGLKPDLTLRLLGDGGLDFPDTDVKATEYWKDPYLKENPDAAFVARFYVLVAIDTIQKRGRVCGWASRTDVQNAPLKNWGQGPRRSLHESCLRKTTKDDLRG